MLGLLMLSAIGIAAVGSKMRMGSTTWSNRKNAKQMMEDGMNPYGLYCDSYGASRSLATGKKTNVSYVGGVKCLVSNGKVINNISLSETKYKGDLREYERNHPDKFAVKAGEWYIGKNHSFTGVCGIEGTIYQGLKEGNRGVRYVVRTFAWKKNGEKAEKDLSSLWHCDSVPDDECRIQFYMNMKGLLVCPSDYCKEYLDLYKDKEPPKRLFSGNDIEIKKFMNAYNERQKRSVWYQYVTGKKDASFISHIKLYDNYFMYGCDLCYEKECKQDKWLKPEFYLRGDLDKIFEEQHKEFEELMNKERTKERWY